MAKSKVKKSSKGTGARSKRAATSTKRASKSAAGKKAPARAAARPASSRGGAAAPASTDIRQAYKSFLLADYLGEKKGQTPAGKKSK